MAWHAQPRSARRHRRTHLLVALALGALLAAALSVAGASGAAPAVAPASSIALGFMDGEITGFPPAETALELDRARRAGATVWGLGIGWSAVSPTQPPSLAMARNPSWSGYDWTSVDQAVREVTAAGLKLLVVLDEAPAWAEGPNRPSTAVAPTGSWEPSSAWFGAFATAVLTRYSGTYPDPLLAGQDLPGIYDWEPWNEPNLAQYLTPQWRRVGGTYQPESPTIYRGLLNAFYAAARQVSSRDVVAAGATAPFGDPPGGPRMPPAQFWRALLCVSAGTRPQSTHCHARVHFDAISHHPYPVGPPTYHAVNADDVSVPDLAKITSLVSVAEAAGTVTPPGAKPLWITEISWDTHPAYDGIGFAAQARYLEGAIDVLYHEGASMFLWYGLRDEPLDTASTMNLASGVYTRGATPTQDKAKPSLTAFRFPFTAYRTAGVAALWGMAPAAGPVKVEERQSSAWVTVATLNASATRVFGGSLVVGPRTDLRAVSAGSVSLTWKTK